MRPETGILVRVILSPDDFFAELFVFVQFFVDFKFCLFSLRMESCPVLDRWIKKIRAGDLEWMEVKIYGQGL